MNGRGPERIWIDGEFIWTDDGAGGHEYVRADLYEDMKLAFIDCLKTRYEPIVRKGTNAEFQQYIDNETDDVSS